MELRVRKQWNQAGKSNSGTDPGGIDLITISQSHSFLVFCCCKPQNELFHYFKEVMMRQHGAESHEAMEPSREE